MHAPNLVVAICLGASIRYLICLHRKQENRNGNDMDVQVLLLLGAFDASGARGCSIFSLDEHEIVQACLIILNEVYQWDGSE